MKQVFFIGFLGLAGCTEMGEITTGRELTPFDIQRQQYLRAPATELAAPVAQTADLPPVEPAVAEAAPVQTAAATPAPVEAAPVAAAPVAAAPVEAAPVAPPMAEPAAPSGPLFDGATVKPLDGALVSVEARLQGPTADITASIYSDCVVSQYALTRGLNFARRVTMSEIGQGPLSVANATYTLSKDLPVGQRVLEASTVVGYCTENGIPLT